MNNRERFQKVMHFEKPDRLPIYEWLGFWPETINRWYSEGLPWATQIKTSDIGYGTDYFGHDERIRIAIDDAPIPYFVAKTLHEDERYRIQINFLGVVSKSLKTGTSMPTFIYFPIKNREDFERMKERFNPSDPRRYPKDWSEDLIEHCNAAESPVYIHIRGFFDQLRSRSMGLQQLLVSFYKDPDFLSDMLDFWADFLIEVMRKAVENIKIDFVSFGEDISYKKWSLYLA